MVTLLLYPPQKKKNMNSLKTQSLRDFILSRELVGGPFDYQMFVIFKPDSLTKKVGERE